LVNGKEQDLKLVTRLQTWGSKDAIKYNSLFTNDNYNQQSSCGGDERKLMIK